MSITLADLCDVMNNWFDENSKDGTKNRYFGTFTIENGQIDLSKIGIQENQYYRIVGSVFNDGVYQYHAPVEVEDTEETEDDTEDTEPENTEPSGENQGNEPSETNAESSETNALTEETEPEEPELTDETFEGAIWAMAVPKKVINLLGEINDWDDKYGPIVASPFNSESFGGYSYYKGYKNTMSTVTTSWSSKFAEQINKWRKVRNI